MSFTRQWEYAPLPPKEFTDQLQDVAPLERQMAWNRGLKTREELKRFFNPRYPDDLHSPWRFAGMRTAVDRIHAGIQAGEDIVVYADYDADGVCAASVLMEGLRRCGGSPRIYIPDRAKEGHGLNTHAVAELAHEGARLIVTVDCGISSVRETDEAKTLGVDVVMIEHHEVPDPAPKAVAIVNPKMPGETYPFNGLSGTGVAFKVTQALMEACGVAADEREWHEKWLLDRVAVATIADMMVLQDENRTLVHYGLFVLAQTRNPGLRALMETARVTPVFDRATRRSYIDAETVAFRLAPRLNAASRMDHADTAFALLASSTVEEARTFALLLEQHNRDRQKATERVLREIERAIAAKDEPFIFEADVGWPIGIAGLVAGRLMDRYNKPIFVIERRNGESVGSVRSANISAVELLDRSKDILADGYGGHATAAGFTVKTELLPALRRRIGEILGSMESAAVPLPSRFVEATLEPEDVGSQTIESIGKFAPFGHGNPAPLFLLSGWQVADARAVGSNGDHRKLWLTKKTASGGVKGVDAIAFGLGGEEGLFVGSTVDFVGRLNLHEWKGEAKPQFQVTDWHPASVVSALSENLPQPMARRDSAESSVSRV